MTKLHQVLAVEKDVKQASSRTITDGYHLLQKSQLLQGIARNYKPKDEDGDHLPSESTRVQVITTTVIADAEKALERLWNTVATKDFGNTVAKADVVVNGVTLMSDVPTTYLLWLEKELNDVHTLISNLPTLDPAEEWTFDPNTNSYVTEVVQTTRTKKVPKVLTLAQATDKFPAQVETYQEDVVVGTWETRKFSGALPAADVKALLERVAEVREAVKVARSIANDTQIDQQQIAAPVLSYIFG